MFWLVLSNSTGHDRLGVPPIPLVTSAADPWQIGVAAELNRRADDIHGAR